MNSWNPFKYPPKAVLKTIYAFLLPGLVAMGSAYTRASTDPSKPISSADWIAAAIAMLLTGAVVFGVKNQDVDQPVNNEVGAIDLWTAVGFALIVIGVLGLLHVLAISLAISVILVVIGVLLIVLGGGYIGRR